jgi:molybdopterin converting factor small subunit
MIVNGAAIPAQQAATTVLSEGDTVALLPPIAGG